MTDPIDSRPKSPFAGRTAASLTGDELQLLASQAFAEAAQDAAAEGFAVPGFEDGQVVYGLEEDRYLAELKQLDPLSASERTLPEAALARSRESMQSKIRIWRKAFERTGAEVHGRIPLPTRIERFTVSQSPSFEKLSAESKQETPRLHATPADASEAEPTTKPKPA